MFGLPVYFLIALQNHTFYRQNVLSFFESTLNIKFLFSLELIFVLQKNAPLKMHQKGKHKNDYGKFFWVAGWISHIMDTLQKSKFS